MVLERVRHILNAVLLFANFLVNLILEGLHVKANLHIFFQLPESICKPQRALKYAISSHYFLPKGSIVLQ